MAPPVRIEADQPKPEDEYPSGDEQPAFRHQGGPELGRGDALEDEGAAPDRRQEDHTRVIGSVHGVMIARAGRSCWPFSDLAP